LEPIIPAISSGRSPKRSVIAVTASPNPPEGTARMPRSSSISLWRSPPGPIR
jgi:hypothetical protein